MLNHTFSKVVKIAGQRKMLTRYLVVTGASITQFTIIGLLFSYGIFFKELELEFGWSRTMLSSCLAIAFLSMGILAIIGGHLTNKYGPSLVLGISGILFGLGFALISQISEPWHLFIIFGIFIGIGLSTHDVATLSTIAHWFPKRRGFITAIVKIGTAFGQIMLPLIAAFLILKFDWRLSTIIIGLTAACLLFLSAFLVKLPKSLNLKDRTRPIDGIFFNIASKSPTFKKLCAIQFLYFPTLMTIPTHIAVHGTDLGMTQTKAAFLLSAIGAASIVGRLSVGIFLDKMGGKKSYLFCFIPILLSLLIFIFITNHIILFIFVALYGFAHGALFVVVSPTIAEYFGLRDHASLFGIVVFCGTIGGAIGPILAGTAFDFTGSYNTAFATLFVLVTLSSIVVLTLPETKRR
jgi:MFS family permease